MRTRLWLARAAVATLGFSALSTCLASRILEPTTNVEALQSNGTLTQYRVINNRQTTPFDVTLLVVGTTAVTPNPTTSNLNWIAESLTASTWTQAMPTSTSSGLSWQQFTGTTYLQAFPDNPLSLNGYFLNYTFDSGSGNVTFPGAPSGSKMPFAFLGGFFYQGAAEASTFLIEGPSDSSVPTPPGSFQSFEDTTFVFIPEPTALSLCLFALGGAAAFVRRMKS